LSGLRHRLDLERAMGIEPTSEAWEALDKTLKAIDLAALSFLRDGLNWKLDGNGVLGRACLGHASRLQQLRPFLLTTNVSNKLRNCFPSKLASIC